MADIKLKDGSGQEQTYTGISKLKIPMADGSYADFVEDNTLYDTLYYSTYTTTAEVKGWSKLESSYPALAAKIPKGTSIAWVKIHRSDMEPQFRFPLTPCTDYTVDTSNEGYDEVAVPAMPHTIWNIGDEAKTFKQYTTLLICVRHDGKVCRKNGDGYDLVTSTLPFPDITGYYLSRSIEMTPTPLKNVEILSDMVFPKGIFNYQTKLRKIVFPAVSTIKSDPWYGCRALAEFDFSRATQIPELESHFTFSDDYLPDNYVIKVPAALCDEWKTTGQWQYGDLPEHIVAV